MKWAEINGIYRPTRDQRDWREDYRRKRYLKHLSNEQLRQRFIDIFQNLYFLRQDSKLVFPPPDTNGEHWTQIFTQVLEEHVLRFGPFPNGFTDGFMKNIGILRPDSARAKRAIAATQKWNPPNTPYFVKYGCLDHLAAMVEGSIRISPASTYSDPSLNKAIKDDELSLDFYLSPSEFKLEAFDGRTGISKGIIELIDHRFTVTTKSNYYVYCFSSILDPRLFCDFEYDACLIVKDTEEFARRVVEALREQLPGWQASFAKVEYVDPVMANPIKTLIPIAKHFRYAYQKELRFIWFPPKPLDALEPRFIKVADIQNFCELITI